MKLNNRLIVTFLLALTLLTALVVPGVLADNGAPQPGTVTLTSTSILYPAAALSGTGTVYSAAPRIVSGQDVSQVRRFNSADVFVTADISGTAVITVTPQFAPDQSGWADAHYTVISGTTATNLDYQVVLSADGSDYVSVPVAGEYLRVKIEYSGVVTPLVQTTLRNN